MHTIEDLKQHKYIDSVWNRTRYIFNSRRYLLVNPGSTSNHPNNFISKPLIVARACACLHTHTHVHTDMPPPHTHKRTHTHPHPQIHAGRCSLRGSLEIPVHVHLKEFGTMDHVIHFPAMRFYLPLFLHSRIYARLPFLFTVLSRPS